MYMESCGFNVNPRACLFMGTAGKSSREFAMSAARWRCIVSQRAAASPSAKSIRCQEPITQSVLDTLSGSDNDDDVTDVTRYYDLANTLPGTAPNTGDPIIGKSAATYDSLGQVYRTFEYNPSGTVATVSNTWYDADGNVIETQAGGTQEFTKTSYDGLDQPTTFTTATTPPAASRGPPREASRAT